jgi:phosphatidate cytidylyltransferase
MLHDRVFVGLLAGVGGVLALATVIGLVLRSRASSSEAKRTVTNLNARIRAWWVMVGVFALALWAGLPGVVVLFGFMSFVALREMLTLSPTRRGIITRSSGRSS